MSRIPAYDVALVLVWESWAFVSSVSSTIRTPLLVIEVSGAVPGTPSGSGSAFYRALLVFRGLCHSLTITFKFPDQKEPI